MNERKPYPSETAPRFIVRFPEGMREQIEASAKENNRSMNAEIVARLSESLEMEAPAATGIIGKVMEQGTPEYRQDLGKMLIKKVRRLPADKQAALLTLLQDMPADK